MKRTAALLTALLMLMLTACSGNNENISPSESGSFSEFAEENISESSTDLVITEDNTQAVSVKSEEDENESTSVTNGADNPSDWTKEEIIEFYKKAASKSNPNAKSTQVMVLNELVINDGDGALGFFIKILEPAIASVVKKNAFDFDGITGGFANLTVDDAQSIKAYKSGDSTIVEMIMKPQTDGVHGKEYEGSVGHAITVLGDVSKVLAEFPQFEVDLDNADVDVHYVNPTVKVKINKDGIIEKGSWQYTCDPEIRNITISGITIRKADAKIDYIITVGGGF